MKVVVEEYDKHNGKWNKLREGGQVRWLNV